MKKNFKYIAQLSLVAVFSLSVVSCSEDKPEATAPATTNSKSTITPDNSEVVTPQKNNDNPAMNLAGDKKTRLEENITNAPTTTMTFTENSHDFGEVALKSSNEHIFKFTNSGDVPLVINNASATCGCTVPEWPKEPIAPGADGEIKVVFKPKDNQAGSVQNKTVTIKANLPGGSTQLNISASVAKA